MLKLEKYILEHCTQELPVLNKIYRDTHLKQVNPRMISGPLQGAFLSMVSHMVKPKTILEIGTYTGYSAICLAQGLPERGGFLHTLETNDEIAEIARQNIADAKMDSKIILHVGDALMLIPKLNIQYDLIFIDGEKTEYPEYFYLCMQYLKVGGYMLADNVLWDNKVLTLPEPDDKQTIAILKFNELIQQNENLENVLLPLRDGLMIARKIN